jgi:hypothetical protein
MRAAVEAPVITADPPLGSPHHGHVLRLSKRIRNLVKNLRVPKKEDDEEDI